MADEVLQQGVRGITDLMVMPGLINLDFADVRSVMQEMGKAMMGTGEAEGDNRALEAAQKAIANPLLDGVSMKGAKGVIISITGGEDMRLLEVDEAANHIRELVDPDANIIWGSAFNPDLEGKIRVSVVATGIEADTTAKPVAEPSRAFSFGAPRRPSDAPAEVVAETAPEVVAEPVAEAVVEAAPDVTEPTAEATPPEAPAAETGEAELVLGAEAEVPAPSVFGEEDFHDPAPSAEAAPARRRWLSPGAAAEEPAAAEPEADAKPKVGGTLFERMSSATRGAARDETPTEGNPLDIPRFLHRQNNQ
jgi:cell division protein FtsZ